MKSSPDIPSRKTLPARDLNFVVDVILEPNMANQFGEKFQEVLVEGILVHTLLPIQIVYKNTLSDGLLIKLSR